MTTMTISSGPGYSKGRWSGEILGVAAFSFYSGEEIEEDHEGHDDHDDHDDHQTGHSSRFGLHDDDHDSDHDEDQHNSSSTHNPNQTNTGVNNNNTYNPGGGTFYPNNGPYQQGNQNNQFGNANAEEHEHDHDDESDHEHEPSKEYMALGTQSQIGYRFTRNIGYSAGAAFHRVFRMESVDDTWRNQLTPAKIGYASGHMTVEGAFLLTGEETGITLPSTPGFMAGATYVID